MSGRKSAVRALLELKCCRCRKGEMFAHPLTKITKFEHMNPDCPHCGFHFEVEPGFFWGAMFISYILTVMVVGFCGLGTYLLFTGAKPWLYIMNCVIMLTLLSPVTFRYSRIVMLYLFSGVGFDESKE